MQWHGYGEVEEMNRRNFIIKSIGAAICAGIAPRFMPSLIGGTEFGVASYLTTRQGILIRNSGVSTIYVGSPDIDITNGLGIEPGEEFFARTSLPLQIKSNHSNYRVMEFQ